MQTFPICLAEMVGSFISNIAIALITITVLRLAIWSCFQSALLICCAPSEPMLFRSNLMRLLQKYRCVSCFQSDWLMLSAPAVPMLLSPELLYCYGCAIWLAASNWLCWCDWLLRHPNYFDLFHTINYLNWWWLSRSIRLYWETLPLQVRCCFFLG